MKKKSLAKKQKSGRVYSLLEYYQRPFMLLFSQIESSSFSNQEPHDIRASFFSLLSARAYNREDAYEMLSAYRVAIDSRLKEIICKASKAYWLHVHRRVAPRLGIPVASATVALVKGIITGAIYKYGISSFCDKIGDSAKVPIERVFNGLLLAEQFKQERDLLKSQPGQLVLLDFTEESLKQYLEVEKLALEMWRCGAQMRGVGKGAILEVSRTNPYVFERRTDELEELISSYDIRCGGFESTRCGVTYDVGVNKDDVDIVFVPTVNANSINSDGVNGVLSALHTIKLPAEYIPNFLLVPLSLKRYWENHRPLDSAFIDRHGFTFSAILYLIERLCYNVRSYIGSEDGERTLLRLITRGYEGIYTRSEITTGSIRGIGAWNKRGYGPISDSDVLNALDFLSLWSGDEYQLDLISENPKKLIIGVTGEKVIIESSHVLDLLYGLFDGVNLSNAHFKGPLLERRLAQKKSYLRTTELEHKDGGRKQIDYSYVVGDVLIIVDCKAIAMQPSHFLGNPSVLRVRHEKVFLEALLGADGIDSKAAWLARYPKGQNYEVGPIRSILPVVVTPFCEYIPSKDRRLWINETIPRVLAPLEFEDFLSRKEVIEQAWNRVWIPDNADFTK